MRLNRKQKLLLSQSLPLIYTSPRSNLQGLTRHNEHDDRIYDIYSAPEAEIWRFCRLKPCINFISHSLKPSERLLSTSFCAIDLLPATLSDISTSSHIPISKTFLDASTYLYDMCNISIIISILSDFRWRNKLRVHHMTCVLCNIKISLSINLIFSKVTNYELII